MRARTIGLGVLAAAALAALANVLIPKLVSQGPTPTPTYWPTQGWRSSTPEEQGLDSVKLTEMLQAIQENNTRIDSLLVIRNGSELLDAYFYNPYDGTFPHDMASVTKSVMTTLIGIAVDQGKIKFLTNRWFPTSRIAPLPTGMPARQR